MSMTQQELKDRADAVSQEIFKLLNCGQTDFTKRLWDELSREHRTLQQNFWRMILSLAHDYQNSRHDMRNVGSVNFAKHIAEFKGAVPYI